MAKHLTARQKAALKVLWMIVRILDPTGYGHQIKELEKEVREELEGESHD
jgi:hypothetical protein